MKITRTGLALASFPVLLTLLTLTGCVSEGPGRKKPATFFGGSGGSIQQLDVLALPVALNFDQIPGPDGFVIKVYASDPKRPKPFAIEDGKLEVYLFDGVPGFTEAASPEPRRIWTYTAQQLKPYQTETSIGIGYEFALLWGEAKPRGDRISVAVRHTAASGRVVSSAPSVISVATR